MKIWRNERESGLLANCVPSQPRTLWVAPFRWLVCLYSHHTPYQSFCNLPSRQILSNTLLVLLLKLQEQLKHVEELSLQVQYLNKNRTVIVQTYNSLLKRLRFNAIPIPPPFSWRRKLRVAEA